MPRRLLLARLEHVALPELCSDGAALRIPIRICLPSLREPVKVSLMLLSYRVRPIVGPALTLLSLEDLADLLASVETSSRVYELLVCSVTLWLRLLLSYSSGYRSRYTSSARSRSSRGLSKAINFRPRLLGFLTRCIALFLGLGFLTGGLEHPRPWIVPGLANGFLVLCFT